MNEIEYFNLTKDKIWYIPFKKSIEKKPVVESKVKIKSYLNSLLYMNYKEMVEKPLNMLVNLYPAGEDNDELIDLTLQLKSAIMGFIKMDELIYGDVTSIARRIHLLNKMVISYIEMNKLLDNSCVEEIIW